MQHGLLSWEQTLERILSRMPAEDEVEVNS
jgi:hypothetical protein